MRGPREHRNVTGRSASDSRAIAARHHSRAPSGSSAALEAGPLPCSARRGGGSHQCRAKAAGLPDCKGVAEAAAGKTRKTVHRPFPSIGYDRPLGLFGSTLDVWAKEPVRRQTAPTGTEPPASD